MKDQIINDMNSAIRAVVESELSAWKRERLTKALINLKAYTDPHNASTASAFVAIAQKTLKRYSLDFSAFLGLIPSDMEMYESVDPFENIDKVSSIESDIADIIELGDDESGECQY
jgi:hypothetical protein